MKHLSIYCFLFALMCLAPAVPLPAQGAWNPPGADLSRPRTLCRPAEIPALQAYLGHPQIYPLYQTLWNQVQSFSPGNMTVDGHRRNAAHAAKNCAFILLLDRKPTGGNLDTLSTAEAAYLRHKAISLLNIINTAVEAYPDINAYLWRSNEIIDNAIAYDLLKGAGVPQDSLDLARDLIQQLAGNLHEEVAFNLFGLGFFGLHVDNHALRTAGALGMAAIALNDAQSGNSHDQPTSWINTAMHNIDNVLWRDADRQSEPGALGGYSEGTHYLRFGMKHVLPFVHAMGNFLPDTSMAFSFDGSTRTIRNPWFDPNFRSLFQWVMKIRLPDGTMPPLEDSNVMVAFPESVILEDPALACPVTYTWFHPDQPNSLWQQLHYSSDDVVADYIASMTQPQPGPDSLFLVLPESGNLLMRSGWDSLARYLHFTAKHGRAREAGKGHNQADAGSFILHAYGQMLALDAGYLKWDRRDEVSNADNHNMILVNGGGPVNGSTLAGGDADAYLANEIDLLYLDYATVRTGYEGSDIVRKPLFVRRSYYLLADSCRDTQSPFNSTYTWQLHGYGLEGGDSIHGRYTHFPTLNRGIWTRNGVSLLAQVTAIGDLDQLTRQTGIHELRYDSMQEHTTLLAEKSGAEAIFLAALVPFRNDTPQVRALCGADCSTLMIRDSIFLDFLFQGVVTAAASGLSGDLVSDADLCFYSEDSLGGFSQFFSNGGTLLRKGTDTIVDVQPRMDLAFSVLDASNYEGFASSAGTARLFDLNFAPGSVLGAGVSGWSYDAGRNILIISFSQAGRFTVHEAVIIGVNDNFRGEMLEVWPHPAGGRVQVRVQEAGELRLYDLQGREVLRSALSGGVSTLELGKLSPGTYLMNLFREGQRKTTRKLIVQ